MFGDHEARTNLYPCNRPQLLGQQHSRRAKSNRKAFKDFVIGFILGAFILAFAYTAPSQQKRQNGLFFIPPQLQQTLQKNAKPKRYHSGISNSQVMSFDGHLKSIAPFGLYAITPTIKNYRQKRQSSIFILGALFFFFSFGYMLMAQLWRGALSSAQQSRNQKVPPFHQAGILRFPNRSA